VKREIVILDDFIRERGLRHTPQREAILRVFLGIEKHLSIDELYKIVKRRNSKIGYVTVYRTMKVLKEAGLCNEIDFGDGIARFEHQYGHGHHDHLVCLKCGSCIEVINPEIEKLQDELASENRFVPLKHKLQIFGTCKKCLG
jgi:Fur family transcriptional regulator, ferric uptake regulator